MIPSAAKSILLTGLNFICYLHFFDTIFLLISVKSEDLAFYINKTGNPGFIYNI
jgi:hypothetical protein